tara:strand:+ start:322 stop:483 length:162 start_codon:yes stop_codon:yes gene_type:complete
VKISIQLTIAGWLTLLADIIYGLPPEFGAIAIHCFIGAMILAEIGKQREVKHG